jgi:hypothetical protein
MHRLPTPDTHVTTRPTMSLDQCRAAAHDALVHGVLLLHQQLTPRDRWPSPEQIWNVATEVVNGTPEQITAARDAFICLANHARAHQRTERQVKNDQDPESRIVAAAKIVEAALANPTDEVLAIARSTREQCDKAWWWQVQDALAEAIADMKLMAGARADGLLVAATRVAREMKRKDLPSALLQARLVAWALKNELNGASCSALSSESACGTQR